MHFQIEEILDQEMIEEIILKNRNSTDRLEAVKKLLSIVKNKNRNLSKSMMKILELSSAFDENSIEYKLVVVQIFQYLAHYLNSSQIQFLLDQINV